MRTKDRSSADLPLCAAVVAALAIASPIAAMDGERSRPRSAARGLAPATTMAPQPAESPGSSRRRSGVSRHPAGFSLTADSKVVNLGEVLAGGKQSVVNALALHVVADRRWVVKAMPRVRFAGSTSTAPASRLQWRAQSSSGFTRFSDAAPSALARGGPTSPGGVLVTIDLQLLMETTDAPGAFEMDMDLILEEE